MSRFLDAVLFTPTAGGTTDWTFSAAVQGYNAPAAGGVVNGGIYKYRAEDATLTQWEIGYGAYNTATGVLARTTVLYNSAGTTAKINFTSTPNVGMGMPSAADLLWFDAAQTLTTAQQQQARANIGADFESGTVALFVQTSAPTGWTKNTTHNDKALRIVSGTASSGGTNSFSTVMAQTVVGSTTLTLSQIPAINPSVSGAAPNDGCFTSGGSGAYVNRVLRATNLNSSTFSATFDNFGWSTPGGGGSHNHSITMAMQYVDAIIATKN